VGRKYWKKRLPNWDRK